jgi:hypothetical protein
MLKDLSAADLSLKVAVFLVVAWLFRDGQMLRITGNLRNSIEAAINS